MALSAAASSAQKPADASSLDAENDGRVLYQA